MLIARGGRGRNRGVGIEGLRLGLRQVLQRILVLSVGREERHHETEWLPLRPVPQEGAGVSLVLGGHMDLAAIRFALPVRATIRRANVKLLLRKRAAVPLTDEPHVVVVGPQQAGPGLSPRRLEGVKRPVAMPRHPLPGEQAGTAHAADRGGHAVVREPHTAAGEGVEPRRLHDRVAGAAERVVPPVVGIEHDNVLRLLVRPRHGRSRERPDD